MTRGEQGSGSDSPDLRRIQELFWALIAAPQGVRPGMAELRASGQMAAGDLSFMIRGDDRLAPEDRLDVYANMYFYRLRDSLAEDFPKVAAIIGGASFHNLITDYLLAHPSRHWSLRYLGVPFAAFLASHDLSRSFPFLADLARLEWARIEMFDAADAEVLTREAAAAAGPDLHLALVPATTLLPLEWNVAPIWRRLEHAASHDDGGGSNSAAVTGDAQEEFAAPLSVDRPEQQKTSILVWRQGFAVYHRTLPPTESHCLELALRDGVSLPDLCEILMGGEAGPDTQVAMQTVAGLLGRWLQDGLVVKPGFGSS